MTTIKTVTPTAWLEPNVVAKLQRSKTWMWIALAIAAALLVFGYAENHSALEAMQQQSIPSFNSALKLEADFRAMDAHLEKITAPIATGRKKHSEDFDYEKWKEHTASDMRVAMSITPPGGLLTFTLHGLPPVVDVSQLYEPGYADYREQVDELNAALTRGDIQAAKESFADSREILMDEVYPVTAKMQRSGLKGTDLALTDYQKKKNEAKLALIVAAVLLLSITSWQYVFILATCRIVFQGTALTMLFALAAIGWCWQDYSSLDIQLTRAIAQELPGMQSPPFTLLSPPQQDEIAKRAPEHGVMLAKKVEAKVEPKVKAKVEPKVELKVKIETSVSRMLVVSKPSETVMLPIPAVIGDKKAKSKLPVVVVHAESMPPAATKVVAPVDSITLTPLAVAKHTSGKNAVLIAAISVPASHANASLPAASSTVKHMQPTLPTVKAAAQVKHVQPNLPLPSLVIKHVQPTLPAPSSLVERKTTPSSIPKPSTKSKAPAQLSIVFSSHLTLLTPPTLESTQTAVVIVQGEVRKGEDRINHLRAILMLLWLSGLSYSLAVSRAQKIYE